MSPVISIKNLNKTYEGGFEALKNVSLDIEEGEIFALLGPNGAGKTTLIGTVCGIVQPTSGSVMVSGHDISKDFRKARELIGLVPQELTLDFFSTPWRAARFSRGLFGKATNDELVERILKALALWDKKDEALMALSGGMKRRVSIAKALAHEPRVLFLDEPTAGVDVELRKGMWEIVRRLREDGVTIILTTHYIEEAEEMADRIGVITGGELRVVEDKTTLMHKLGKKYLSLQLNEPLNGIPDALADRGLSLSEDRVRLTYEYDTQAERTGITRLLADIGEAGIGYRDLETHQSSLEEIFVDLVEAGK